jgi:Ca2+-binding EF-hand superfamily protein
MHPILAFKYTDDSGTLDSNCVQEQMSKPSSADPLMVQAKKIAPLVPDSVVEALVKAANESQKQQATAALTPRLARALMDPNPTQSKHVMKSKPLALVASKVDFPSRTPSASAGINPAVEACLERLVRRMSSRVKDSGAKGVALAVKQSLHECDIDSDGHVTRAELVLALKHCGAAHPDKSDVDIIMAAFDRSGGGLVNIASLEHAFKHTSLESRTAPNSAAGARFDGAKLLEIIRTKLLDKLTPANVQALRNKYRVTPASASGVCSASLLLELLQAVGVQGQPDITRDIWSAFGCSSLHDSIDFSKLLEHIMIAKSSELDDLYKVSSGGGRSSTAPPTKPNDKAIKFLRDRITSHLPAMVPRHMLNEFKHHDTNKDNTIDKGEFHNMMSKYCAARVESSDVMLTRGRYHIKVTREEVDEIFA